MDLKILNKYCWERVNQYLSLDIYGTKISTPYFINNVERFFVDLMKKAKIDTHLIEKVRSMYKDKNIPYGWYRGKGTPEQIEQSTLEISKRQGLSLKMASKETILEFMKLYALGVDCSGFAYNILFYAINKSGNKKKLDQILDWKNKSIKNVYQAGAFVFAGKASELVNPNQLKELDLILIRNPKSNKHIHIAIILKDDKNKLVVVQSVISKSPSGVRVDGMKVKNNQPFFEFQPEIGGTGNGWENLYKKGYLEFRRLIT
jgi:hypothetical protein